MFAYLTMDTPSRRTRKKRRVRRPSDGVSVSSAASMNGLKFIDSKGNVKLNRLPSHHLGRTSQEVAAALLLNPTGSEAVGVVILSSTLKNEYRARCVGDFASKQQQIETKTAHLKELEACLGVNNTTWLRLNDQNANLQAQLAACNQENTHLEGQKKKIQHELAAIKDDLLVHQSILEIINLTDEKKQPCLAFQTLPLEQVAARLAISTWDDIDSLSFNATHRATMVCNVLGLVRNVDFISLWTAASKDWLRLFGSEPNVQTGRKASPDELKVRLAGYLRILAPRDVIDRVLGALNGGDSDSLSSVEEGQEGEESGEEEVEATIPGSVHVSSQKRSRFSLEEASEEDLIEELRRRNAASSVGVDNNSDG